MNMMSKWTMLVVGTALAVLPVLATAQEEGGTAPRLRVSFARRTTRP